MNPSLQNDTTLGEQLRSRREELSLSIRDAARALHTTTEHITALEEDRYETFSAKIYARGFLKKLAEFLEMDAIEMSLRKFDNEWDVRMYRKRRETTPLPENRGTTLYFTPGRIRLLCSGIILLVFLLFFGSRLDTFLSFPEIIFDEPQENTTFIQEPIFRIKGKTERESRLTVNGREITIDERGNFNEEIELVAGLNILQFLVENRFGKKSEITRYAIVQ